MDLRHSVNIPETDVNFTVKLLSAKEMAVYIVIEVGKKSSSSPRAENQLHIVTRK